MTDRGAYKLGTALPVAGTIGERIRAWRLHFEYSQASLATAVGVRQSTVAMWERNERIPMGPAMNQLVRVLGISEDALVTGRGFRIPELPLLGHTGWPEPDGGGDLVAIEDKTKTPVILPAAHPGEVWGLEVGSGTREPLTPEAAVEWLQAALDQDRAVWIVTKSSGGLKAARRILKRKPKT